jgi:hypothetical protein
MRTERIGIRTSTPQATLHVADNTLQTGCNLLFVEGSNAYPAITANHQGFVGIGTAAVSNQALTVRGKLVVDNIQVGGGSGSGDTRLIVAYGLDHPTDVNYLDFGFSTLSNISNIVAPLIQGENIIQTFSNIANYTFLNRTSTSVSAPTVRGDVTFTTTFFGNAPSYVYTLTAVRNGTTSITVNNTPKVTVGAVDSITATFSSGTYQVHINASASNGGGTGSFVQASNVASFTITTADTIAAPTMTLLSPPTFSTTPLYVASGVQYYTNGTTMTFAENTLAFTNIYQTINPATVLSRVLQIGTTNFRHTDVFTDHLTFNTLNSKAVSVTINSNVIGATVFNINSSNTYPQFVNSVAYVDSQSAQSETVLPSTQYSSVPVSALQRMSTNTQIPAAASITDLTSISGFDALFSPINNTFYSTYTAIESLMGIYYPSYSPVAGTHNQLTLRVTTTAALPSFVLELANAVNVSQVLINWAGINTTWYNAAVLYTQATGCAATVSDVAPTTRFPVRVPFALMDQTLPAQSFIYINITFNGSIPMSGIRLSN